MSVVRYCVSLRRDWCWFYWRRSQNWDRSVWHWCC